MPKTFTCSSTETDGIHNYSEISIDPILLSNYSNEESLAAFLTNQSCSEEFNKLKSELLEEVMSIIHNNLTEKQKEVVIMMYLEGKTQQAISNELGKHQTAVHKIIQGNIDYKTPEQKRYGGALKKIKRLCESNKKIKQILLQMRMYVANNSSANINKKEQI